MKFSDLPIGACFKRGRGSAIKTSEGGYTKPGGSSAAAKPSMRVTVAPCAIRPLIELGNSKARKA